MIATKGKVKITHVKKVNRRKCFNKNMTAIILQIDSCLFTIVICSAFLSIEILYYTHNIRSFHYWGFLLYVQPYCRFVFYVMFSEFAMIFKHVSIVF